MTPRFPSSLSKFRNLHPLERLNRLNRLVRRPAQLKLGVAAATVVAVTGVAVGVSTSVSAGSGHSVGAASNLSAINHAGTVRAAGHTSAGHLDAAGSKKAAHAAKQSPAQHSSSQHPAKSQHAAKSQHSAKSQHAATARAAHHKTPARHRAAARPYHIYDSVTPSAIPGHHVIATYATGNYAVSPRQVAGRGKVLWIDTTGTDHAASILDVEPGDATPSLAANWAWHRLKADPHALARIYTMRSEWPAVKAAVGKLPAHMRSHIRWWIADPTGYPHIVPGSDATQWYWGSSYDITTASPRF